MSGSPTLQERKKQFLEELKTLTADQYYEIFRIIKRNNVEYSENSNGVFFDLNGMDDSIFQKLCQFMELCKTQSQDDATRSKEIDVLRQESDALAMAHVK
jgi:hypothetical protein